MSQPPRGQDGIEAVGLAKHFGAMRAVEGVSFAVPTGEALGFLGPNGAGKSTTMKMLAGFLRPDAGTSWICGHSVEKTPLAARRCLGYMPERGPLYDEMTVAEFLRFVGRIRGLGGRTLSAAIDRVVNLTGLDDYQRCVIGTLSKGYRQRTGLAQALVCDPPCLILDEPTDGLDPNQKDEIRTLLRAMRATKAIILSTHILDDAVAICNQVVILAGGRIIEQGSTDELLVRGGSLESVFREATKLKKGT